MLVFVIVSSLSEFVNVLVLSILSSLSDLVDVFGVCYTFLSVRACKRVSIGYTV